MTIIAWLMSAIGPLAVRALIALGFTAVTFTGVTTVVNTLVGMATANWSAMPAGVLQLAALSGIPQVMGMIFGAYASRMAMVYASSVKRFILK